MRRPLATSFVFFVIGLCLSRYGNGSFLVVVFLILLAAYVLGTLLKRIPLSWGILLLVLLASYGYGEVRFVDSGDLAMENGVFYTVVKVSAGDYSKIDGVEFAVWKLPRGTRMTFL